jgi:hypothetical protein
VAAVLRLEAHSGRYVNHVYGAEEVGATSWLYLSPVPFEQAGFPAPGHAAPPALTEAIQHGVFKYWIAPLGWYAFLAAACGFTGRRSGAAAHPAAHELSCDKVQRALVRRAAWAEGAGGRALPRRRQPARD